MLESAQVGDSDRGFREISESASYVMVDLLWLGRVLDASDKVVGVFVGSRRDMLGKHFTSAGPFSLSCFPRLIVALSHSRG